MASRGAAGPSPTPRCPSGCVFGALEVGAWAGCGVQVTVPRRPSFFHCSCGLRVCFCAGSCRICQRQNSKIIVDRRRSGGAAEHHQACCGGPGGTKSAREPGRKGGFRSLGTTNAAEAQTKLAAGPAAQAALQQRLAELALDATKAQNAEVDQQRQDRSTTRKERAALPGLDDDQHHDRLDRASSVLPGNRWVLRFSVRAGLALQDERNSTLDRNNFVVQIINITVGALTAAFATVVNFWLGSSARSQKKVVQTLRCRRRSPPARARPSTRCKQDRSCAADAGSSRPVSRRRRWRRTTQQSSARFDACMSYVFKAEGGYVNNADDKGGPTNFGITLATLENYEGKSLAADDVKNLTPRWPKKYSRTNYWDRCGAGLCCRPRP